MITKTLSLFALFHPLFATTEDQLFNFLTSPVGKKIIKQFQSTNQPDRGEVGQELEKKKKCEQPVIKHLLAVAKEVITVVENHYETLFPVAKEEQDRASTDDRWATYSLIGSEMMTQRLVVNVAGAILKIFKGLKEDCELLHSLPFQTMFGHMAKAAGDISQSYRSYRIYVQNKDKERSIPITLLVKYRLKRALFEFALHYSAGAMIPPPTSQQLGHGKESKITVLGLVKEINLFWPKINHFLILKTEDFIDATTVTTEN